MLAMCEIAAAEHGGGKPLTLALVSFSRRRPISRVIRSIGVGLGGRVRSSRPGARFRCTHSLAARLSVHC
jgi:hypothetical protein